MNVTSLPSRSVVAMSRTCWQSTAAKQTISNDQQIAFTKTFGEIQPHPLYRSAEMEGYRDILVLEHAARDEDVRAMATTRAAVERLIEIVPHGWLSLPCE